MAPRSNRGGRKQRRIRERLSAYRESRRGRVRRRIPRNAVPSFFTLMGLFSGFLSLIQTLEGRFEVAAWLIVLAAFFDVLDGMMARLTNGTSYFGMELDSLSDIVSFGVAPAFLLYGFGLRGAGMAGVVVASLPAICGAVRLARYNTQFDGEKKDHFEGLPIPAQAAFIVALILNMSKSDWISALLPNDLAILIPAVVVLSILMLTTIPFESVSKPSAAYVRAHPWKILYFASGFLAMVFFQHVGLLIACASYLMIGVGRAIYMLLMAIFDAKPAA